MRTIINFFCISLFTLLFSGVHAQEISREDFIRTIDYFKCECVKIAEKGKNEALELNCDSADDSKLRSVAELKTKELTREIDALKRKADSSWQGETLTKFLTDHVFNNRSGYPNIYGFVHKNEEREVDIRDKLIPNLKGFIAKLATSDIEVPQENLSSAESENVVDDAPTPVVNTFPPQQETKKGFFSFELNFAQLLLALLILTICLLYTVKTKSNLNEQLSGLRRKLTSKSQEFFSFNELRGEVRRLEREISDLKNRQSAMQHEINGVSDKKETPSTESIEDNLQHKKEALSPEPTVKVFYTATPNRDGSFEISSQTDYFKPTVSLYKFTVTEVDALAEFEFSSDEIGLKDAVNYPQTYLDPVCEPVNAPNQSAKRIVTTQKGLARKEADKWIVSPENKARIKYE